jgi:hypothetical protein
MTISDLNALAAKWEPIWLFLILFFESLAGFYTAWMVKREYDYDEQKDLEKKQKKTRTTKKTTTTAAGQVTVDESTEVIEPIETKGEQK